MVTKDSIMDIIKRIGLFLNEDYYGRVKPSYSIYSHEVFVNPSRNEMLSCKNYDQIKFIADSKKKNLYIWDPDTSMHKELWEKEFKGNYVDDINIGALLPGYAEQKGGKWVMVDVDGSYIVNDLIRYLEEYDKLDQYVKKFNWVNKWIDVNKYFKDKSWK